MPLQTFGLTLCILDTHHYSSWHNHDKKHVDNASTNIIKFISKFKLYSLSSLVSFPFTTCFIPIHHCSHSQSPLFSFPFTTVLIPSHHYSHSQSPLFSFPFITCLIPIHHEPRSYSPLVLLLFTTLIPIYHWFDYHLSVIPFCH